MESASASGSDFSYNVSELENFGPENEEAKKVLTNSLIYCNSLSEEANLLSKTPPPIISAASMVIGHEIYKNIIHVLAEKKLVVEENLINLDESDSEEEYEECQDEPDNSSPDFDYSEPSKAKPDFIPLAYKEKVVALATAHPKWSLATLQKQGCSLLKSKDRLSIWKNDIKRGGTLVDKWQHIESETFNRFTEARDGLEQVTTRDLQVWAMSTAFPFLSDTFNFVASKSWVIRFKRKHRIRQRKIIKFVSTNEYATMNDILESAEQFRKSSRELISQFDLNMVINTDQTGCQYHMVTNRTLAEKGAKPVLVKKTSLHHLTHSYTAQYSLTASGKILPCVYLCMQEPSGKFGPRVQETVHELEKQYKNVIVTCSKSGKLTKELFKKFLGSIISPYVNKQKFLLMLDSWGGQTDTVMYDNLYEENGKRSYTLKVIPPKCTSLCQPCDVYFYRQVKNMIKRMQNAPILLKEKREITSREDAIKIHSIVLHQLSAPIFIPMIKYAWYASKLIDEKDIFMNVNDVCFSLLNLKKSCDCKEISFIQCAWCRFNFCFKCFYDNYHTGFCIENSEEK